jgi:DNA-binding MarR family transcriptional regulator
MSKANAQPSAHFKASVALAALAGERSIIDVAQAFEVDVKDAAAWKNQVIRNAALSFNASNSHAANEAGDGLDDLRGNVASGPALSIGPFLQVSFSDNLLYWTRLLETLYNRAFVNKVPPGLISVSAWRVLSWLLEKNALTVGELAQHTHMERTVLGRLLDRMAGHGLIVRTATKHDMRISMTRISAKGRKVFARVQPMRDAIYERAICGIDPARIEDARHVIVSMVTNLGDDANVSQAAAAPDTAQDGDSPVVSRVEKAHAPPAGARRRRSHASNTGSR